MDTRSRRALHVVTVALLILPVVAGLAAAPTPPRRPAMAPYRPDAVLVAFHPTVPLADRFSTVQRLGLEAERGTQSPYFASLQITEQARAAGVTVESAVAALGRDPGVRYAEPDWIVRSAAVPNDARFGEQWALHNSGQTGGLADADIDAPAAWDATTGDGSVVVAVVDSGIDYNHPDLADNILRDGGGNVVGRRFDKDAPTQLDPLDENGHGTHVAGIIGARGNNGIGVSGVCPNVRLMPVRFLDRNGDGYSSDAAKAIDFAVTNGARIINASWGGRSSNAMFDTVLRAREAGILFVAAAGNSGTDNSAFPIYPANLTASVYTNAYGVTRLDNVLSVAATDANDRLAPFSNFGETTVDIAAPGAAVLSTMPTYGVTLNGAPDHLPRDYAVLDGTSMAAPLVSGAAALLITRFPQLGFAELKRRLLASTDRPEGVRRRVISGRINIGSALETDTTAPGAPLQLRPTHRGATTLRLAWSASGDDGSAGQAGLYDLRYSLETITASNFEATAVAPLLPMPGPRGTAEGYTLKNLAPMTPYYIALRCYDNALNVSPLITIGPIECTPLAPALEDTVEGAPLFSGNYGDWSIAEEDASSPSHAYTARRLGSDGQDVLTQGEGVTLTASEDGTCHGLISFRAKLSGDALLTLETLHPGGGEALRLVSGLFRPHQPPALGWRDYQVPFNVVAGTLIRIRFYVSVQPDAVVHLDDIRIFSLPRTFLVRDNAEGEPLFSGDAPWAIREAMHSSPTHSYTDSPEGVEYGGGLDLPLTLRQSVSLSVGAPEFQFMYAQSLESGWDYFLVDFSLDGGTTWQPPLLGFTGSGSSRGPLGAVNLSLPPSYAGADTKVRFRLVTDGGNDSFRDGVWLDDIRLLGDPLTPYSLASPSDLTVLAQSNKAVTLTWTDNCTFEDRYRIERRRTGEPASAYREVRTVPGGPGAGTLTAADGGLTANTTYTYRVRCSSGPAFSPYSEEASGGPLSLPAAPSVLKGEPGSATSINLSWTENAVNESSYSLERRTASSGWAQIQTWSADTTSGSDTGLSEGVGYYYRLRAVRGSESSGFVYSPYSNTTGPVKPVPPPQEPTEFFVHVVAPTRVSLSWRDNSSHETVWHVERRLTGGEWAPLTRRAGTLSMGIMTHLDAAVATGEEYTYRVRAAAGPLPSLWVLSRAVTPKPAPPAPTWIGRGATAISGSAVRLQWQDNATYETRYSVERRRTGDAADPWQEVAVLSAYLGTGARNWTDTGLTANVSYSYRLRALYEKTPSSYTPPASATPVPTPAQPTALRAMALSRASVRLNWTDNAVQETRYHVERKTETEGWREVASLPSNTVSWTNANLAPDTRYYYRVRAANTTVYSAYSSSASATTPP